MVFGSNENKKICFWNLLTFRFECITTSLKLKFFYWKTVDWISDGISNIFLSKIWLKKCLYFMHWQFYWSSCEDETKNEIPYEILLPFKYCDWLKYWIYAKFGLNAADGQRIDRLVANHSNDNILTNQNHILHIIKPWGNNPDLGPTALCLDYCPMVL